MRGDQMAVRLSIVYVVYIHDEERFYTIERLLLQRRVKHQAPPPCGGSAKLQIPSIKQAQSSNIQCTRWAFELAELEPPWGFWGVGIGASDCMSRRSFLRKRIDLARVCRRSNVTYARSTRYCLRLKDRRQRDFYALRCCLELGAQKLALAHADGPGLLRDRADGRGCIALRYRAFRRRGDALFTTAMRCDDRCRHCDLQNGVGGKTNLRANARAEVGDRHGRVRFHGRDVSLVRRVARDRSAFAG